MRPTMARLLKLLAVALCVASCTTAQGAKRIQAFAQATAVTAESVRDAFDTVERNYFEHEVGEVALTGDLNRLNPSSLKDIRFLPEEDLEARLLVLAGIESYAKKLALVMGSQPLQSFDTKTKELGEQLAALNKSFVEKEFSSKTPLKPEEIRIFTTALNALGRWLIEAKRRPAVRQEIAGMKGTFATICDLLVADLGAGPGDARGTVPAGLRGELSRQYTLMLQQQALLIARYRDRMTPAESRSEIRALVSLAEDMQKADATLKATQDALRQLKKTHSQLDTAFDRAGGLDIMLQDLYAEAGRIEKLYESLDKS